MNNINRVCCICKETLPLEKFGKNRTMYLGYSYRCKPCNALKSKEHRERTNYRSIPTKTQKEKYKENRQKWNKTNREFVNARQRTYNKKNKLNPNWRLRHNISSGIRQSIRKSKNGLSWEKAVGYNVDQLKQHLELSFKYGMSWNNYGQWHIDHIKPVSKFNIKELGDIEFMNCWALSNLQPLWATENLIKGPKYNACK